MANTKAQDHNSQLGIKLFLIYATVYFAYVLVNAFAASWVEWKPVAGLNVAVLWGFGLIALAFVMSLVYGLTAANDPVPTEQPSSKGGKE